MQKKHLREGFTTGSAAAAGAKAALLYLTAHKALGKAEIPLPVGGRRMTIFIERVEMVENGAMATVIKDGGDDPDATHMACITTTVRFLAGGVHEKIIIKGGKGVGKVTRPGLPIPVGEPAINPVPRRQIKEAVLEGLKEMGLKGTVSVTIEVANGEKIAKNTLNPRLGIVGGISILGTRGTVKPFSNKAYTATITLSMDVARAAGLSTIALATGGRSERFLKERRPDLSDISFIQVADFFSFSLKEAVNRGFADILYSCFFGKLVKMAQGYPYTHARKSRTDFGKLSAWCLSMGMDKKKARNVKDANTAREVLSIIMEEARKEEIIYNIMEKALISAHRFAGPVPDITYYLFDFEGDLLATEKR